MIGGNMIYYKRYTGKLLPQKTAEQPSWVQWTHHSEGKTHCEECLMLDGVGFRKKMLRLVHIIHTATAH